jgi:hypothetical protein
MYSDRLAKRKTWILWALLLLLLLGALALIFSDGGRDLDDSSALAIREAVQRSALQCYAVEGVYPPDLQYLEDNYGLQVNEEDFYVTYDAFASNLPPTVRVTRR